MYKDRMYRDWTNGNEFTTTSAANIGTTIRNDYVTVDLAKKFVDEEGLKRIAEIINKKIDDINKRLLIIEDHQPSEFVVLRGYNYES